MIPSILLYIGVLIVCFCVAILANKRNSKALAWLIVALLTFFAGFRGDTVGIDTAGYVSKFGLIAEGNFGMAYGLEESFKYFCFIFLKIFNNPTFMLTVLALLTNGCIILRFWELRKVSSFACMVACYYMVFYFASLNCMRQFCAVAIIFYATRYLNQKKLGHYLLGVLAALIFHQTAVMGFLPVFLAVVRWKEYKRRQQLFYLFAVLVLPAIAVVGYLAIQKYFKYFSNISMDIGVMTAIKMAFFVATIIFVFVAQRAAYFKWDYRSADPDERFSLVLAGSCYFIGLCLTALGYIFPFADRISWYFLIFEGAYLGTLLKAKKRQNSVFFGFCILALIGYGFIYSMTHNSQGTMPYRFFWQ